MSTLYIHLPSKAAADHASHWIELACPFALASGDAVEHEGALPLPELAGMIAKAQRVVLLPAACDVTLLRLQVPPLSAAKLKAALPHLVEDQLMSDPAECIIAAGPPSEGVRTVAVVNRGWFEIVTKTVQTLGARHIVAVPAQLCLPYRADNACTVAAIQEQHDGIDLTVRLTEHTGLGLPIVVEQADNAAREAVQTLCAIAPSAPIVLYVPQAALPHFQAAIDSIPECSQRIVLEADRWAHWIAGANSISTSLDVMAGTDAGSGPHTDWRRWRWPLALAAAVLVVQIVGLNLDWWRMKREANTLRAAMMQIYRTTFPKESVIIDPLAQMQQKIAMAKHQAGEVAPDDFIALAAGFGEAWESVGATRTMPGIAALEYRDRSLLVRVKTDVPISADAIKAALAVRNLSLSQPAAGSNTWQIRSNK